jgi:acyl carrier protein
MFKIDMKQQVEERVFQALAELGAETDHMRRDATLEQIDIDSLDLVELAQIVEDEYGVRLEGQDLEGVSTVGEAIDLVILRLP